MTEINGRIFQVAGNAYTVDVNSHVNTSYGNWGACSYGDNTIQIAEGLCKNRRDDTLAHELTHAILYEAGYEDHDEELANRIGKVLYQVLRDNDFGFLQQVDETDECLHDVVVRVDGSGTSYCRKCKKELGAD